MAFQLRAVNKRGALLPTHRQSITRCKPQQRSNVSNYQTRVIPNTRYGWTLQRAIPLFHGARSFQQPRRFFHTSQLTRSSKHKSIKNDTDFDEEEWTPEQQSEFEKASKEIKEKEIAGRVLPEAEFCRSLVAARKSGTFTTVAMNTGDKAPSVPLFGSQMPYILAPSSRPGQPTFAVRRDEMHYSNLQQSPRSSMTVFPLTPRHIAPKDLPLPRVNLLGTAREISDEDEVAKLIEQFDVVHPGSGQFLKDRSLFVFYELELSDVFLMTSTGKLVPLTATEYYRAKVDPIAPVSRPIIDRINQNFKQEMIKFTKEQLDIIITDAFLCELDRQGFSIMGKRPEIGWCEFRYPLEENITDPKLYAASLEDLFMLRRDSI